MFGPARSSAWADSLASLRYFDELVGTELRKLVETARSRRGNGTGGLLKARVRHHKETEDLDMPNTHYSAAAERHLQAAHAHEAHRLSEEAAAKVAKVSKELENR
jgi:hypothetical protein